MCELPLVVGGYALSPCVSVRPLLQGVRSTGVKLESSKRMLKRIESVNDPCGGGDSCELEQHSRSPLSTTDQRSAAKCRLDRDTVWLDSLAARLSILSCADTAKASLVPHGIRASSTWITFTSLWNLNDRSMDFRLTVIDVVASLCLSSNSYR